MAEILNEKIPTLAEGMKLASESEDPTECLKKLIAKDKRWINILGYAINPTNEYKMGLPEGEPNYKRNRSKYGLPEMDALQLHDKLYVLYNQKTPLKNRENIFIDWLERVGEDDAEMLIAIKDKRLHKVYKRVSEFKMVNALGWDEEKYRELKKKFANPN